MLFPVDVLAPIYIRRSRRATITCWHYVAFFVAGVCLATIRSDQSDGHPSFYRYSPRCLFENGPGGRAAGVPHWTSKATTPPGVILFATAHDVIRGRRRLVSNVVTSPNFVYWRNWRAHAHIYDHPRSRRTRSAWEVCKGLPKTSASEKRGGLLPYVVFLEEHKNRSCKIGNQPVCFVSSVPPHDFFLIFFVFSLRPPSGFPLYPSWRRLCIGCNRPENPFWR